MNTDTRQKIRTLLSQDPEQSNRSIAKLAGVSHVTIASIRALNPSWKAKRAVGVDGIARRPPQKGRALRLACARADRALRKLDDELKAQKGKKSTRLAPLRLAVRSVISSLRDAQNSL